MLINLSEALESWAAEQIEHLGYEPRKQQPLNQLMTLSIRILEPKPRTVCTSRELEATLPTLPQNYQEAYRLFRSCVERGTDLRPFMSKTIEDGKYLDGFLFDWGFYHFHLNSTPDSTDQRFIARSEYLLIARVENEIMYFIQILPHCDHMIWYHEELMRIFADNWPDVAERYRIKIADGLSETVDEKKRKELRDEIHANVPVDLGDGRVYIGKFMGINGSGTPLKAILDADAIRRDGERVQAAIDRNENAIVSLIQKKVEISADDIELKLLRPGDNDYVFQVKDIPIIVRLILNETGTQIAVGDTEKQIEEYLAKNENGNGGSNQ